MDKLQTGPTAPVLWGYHITKALHPPSLAAPYHSPLLTFPSPQPQSLISPCLILRHCLVLVLTPPLNPHALTLFFFNFNGHILLVRIYGFHFDNSGPGVQCIRSNQSNSHFHFSKHLLFLSLGILWMVPLIPKHCSTWCPCLSFPSSSSAHWWVVLLNEMSNCFSLGSFF